MASMLSELTFAGGVVGQFISPLGSGIGRNVGQFHLTSTHWLYFESEVLVLTDRLCKVSMSLVSFLIRSGCCGSKLIRRVVKRSPKCYLIEQLESES